MGEVRTVWGRVGNGFVKEWRAKVKPSRSTWLGRPGWRYTIYSKWVSWGPDFTSRWYADRADCEAAANAELDRIEASDEGEWLATTEPEETP